jgi:GTP-binding protein Era
MPEGFRAGLVAMIGKPNVGKSTLLNAIVGQKVSIVSNKPQTTRRRVLGIAHGEGYQVAFIDTPGIHEPHTQLGKAMVESARQSLADIDLVLYVADASKKPDALDKQIAHLVKGVAKLYLCLNKMDLLRAEMVVSTVEEYTKLFGIGEEDFMMTTATREHNLSKLMEGIVARLPEGEPMYDDDTFTDQPMRFMAAELIREKVLQATRQEVPHATAVIVDEWTEGDHGLRIRAEIIVEKQGQRAILIGKQGQFLKKIGTEARMEIEKLVEQPVYLDLYVKVREDWRMNPRMLHEMQYSE